MEDKETLLTNKTHPSFHSEEVQEIMGRQPIWILRWGITVIILIIAGFFIACRFIKYPQTVTATITITSDNPPADLAARMSGILDSVYVVNSEQVHKDQIIALIESAADYEDIMVVEEVLTSLDIESFVRDFRANEQEWRSRHLGDIQTSLITFLNACTEYGDYILIDRIGKKRQLLTDQIWRAKDYYRKLELQRETLVEELHVEQVTLERDSLLLGQNAIAQAEYEEEVKVYVSKKNTLAGFDATMANAQLSRLQLEQQIIELDTQQTTEIAEYVRRLSQERSNLLSQIALWKEQYAIIAPSEGIVSLQNVWSNGQRVNIGDIVASVLPNGEERIIGRLKVPSSGFGKVQAGQEVNIKLNGFPYLEFGILKGKVESISSVPEKVDNLGVCYTVNVVLPVGLESTYHKTFPFVQSMDGIAEIITEDMRLIEWFFRPIRSLFANK